LNKKYTNLSELPRDWLNIKSNTAKVLSHLIPSGSSVFSYGCGLGIVEKYLIETNSVDKIVGYDFASPSLISYKNENFKRIKSLKELESQQFDIIYLSQLIYSLDDIEVINLLKIMCYYLKQNRKLIISHSSIYSHENGIILPKKIFRKRVESKINKIAKKIFILVNSNSHSQYQGWGYIRDNELVEFLAKSDGLQETIFISGAGQSFLICRSH
jgi:hypothetical protein